MNTLVGDIGGTKTILAIALIENGQYRMRSEKTYRSGDYSDLENIISDYLKITDPKIDKACLALAGPVSNNRARITNLPWVVDAKNLRSLLKISSVKLINDLEAIACSIPYLKADDILILQEGLTDKQCNIAVIAPGTGLGEAYLTYDHGTYNAHPSEGAHASFSPINDLQTELLNYVQNQGFDHVSFERVCSGSLGVPNIYNFLRDTGKEIEPKWLSKKLADGSDPTPIIIETALNDSAECSICRSALELFCEILAVETGNLALKILSTGGIYIAGGIAGKIIKELKKPYFIHTMQQKGRFSEQLKAMPVKIIKNRNAGLIGAAVCEIQ